MQQAISYRSSWAGPSISAAGGSISPGHIDDAAPEEAGTVEAAVADNAVIVFGQRGCCMCHVARQLLLGQGVNPTMFEVDGKDEAAVVEVLTRIAGAGASTGSESDGGGVSVSVQFPVVFVGGKMLGGLEKVMGAHISGDLVPILREAGALWL